MTAEFDYFVILAGMRTGSNFLEESLREYENITSYGEAFNPNFFGAANQKTLLGLTMADRERDPIAVLKKMKEKSAGIFGFRLFHDHDPRAFNHCIQDRRCAKIVLQRNPVDSFVSLEIARKTGQWRLQDVQKAKTGTIRFDRNEFDQFLQLHQEFYRTIRHQTQATGQAIFRLNYEDISNPEIVAGLARFLGAAKKLPDAAPKIIRQNPKTLEEKVSNYAEMITGLGTADYLELGMLQTYESKRGPAVPSYLAAPGVPILFAPIKCGPTKRVQEWLAGPSGDTAELQTGFTQKSLRQWKRKAGNHRSFSVVSHPVTRLFRAYEAHFTTTGTQAYSGIRETLREHYGINFPTTGSAEFDQPSSHRLAFGAFSKFVSSNLAGQTSIRVDAAWASQHEILRGFSQFAAPDHILRERSLAQGLSFLAGEVGVDAGDLPPEQEFSNVTLADIYDDEIEASVRSAYQRDYMVFGFARWDDEQEVRPLASPELR